MKITNKEVRRSRGMYKKLVKLEYLRVNGELTAAQRRVYDETLKESAKINAKLSLQDHRKRLAKLMEVGWKMIEPELKKIVR